MVRKKHSAEQIVATLGHAILARHDQKTLSSPSFRPVVRKNLHGLSDALFQPVFVMWADQHVPLISLSLGNLCLSTVGRGIWLTRDCSGDSGPKQECGRPLL